VPRVFWSILKADGYDADSVDTFVRLGAEAERQGHGYFSCPKMNTCDTRNHLVQAFRQHSTDPNDALVMLDADHEHPGDIVTHLARNPVECGVVLALCFSRHEPYNPVAYYFGEDGRPRALAQWDEGTVEVDAVGGGALLIRRWVFDQLEAKGVKVPFFRWNYTDGVYRSTTGEDFYFSTTCTAHGVKVYVDTTVVTPHLGKRLIKGDEWAARLHELNDRGVKPPQTPNLSCVAHDEGNKARKPLLTPAQQKVMDRIAKGFTNRQIADDLVMSVKTVETHKAHLINRLGLENTTQLHTVAVKAACGALDLNSDEFRAGLYEGKGRDY
jgi:DNA-binding CsgD family transcriptional regulator